MNLRATKSIYLVLTACLIVGGIILIIWPNVGLAFLCKAFGVFLIAYGIAKVIGYFSKELFQLAFQFGLGLGIASVILGIAMIVKTDSIVNFLAGCIGIFLLVDAALKIQTAIDSKKFGIPQWLVILLVAIMTGIVGTMLLFTPHEATAVLVRLVGLSFAIDGLMNLIVVCNTFRTVRKNNDNIIDI